MSALRKRYVFGKVTARISDRLVQGEIVTPRTGLADHLFVGQGRDQFGDTYTLRAVVNGVHFVRRETRGRRTDKARDVAVYLAGKWFSSGGQMPEVPSGCRSQVRAAMELWAARGHDGLSDQKNANLVLRRGQELLSSFDALLFEDGPTEGARLIAVPERAVKRRSGGLVALDCPGWAWTYGAPRAEFGRVRYDGPLAPRR